MGGGRCSANRQGAAPSRVSGVLASRARTIAIGIGPPCSTRVVELALGHLLRVDELVMQRAQLEPADHVTDLIERRDSCH